MGTKIKFKTVGANGRFSSGKGSCSGRIIHNGSLTIDNIAADFAKFAKIDVHDARFYATYFTDYIVKAVSDGKRLNLGPFSLYLSMKGRIDGANGKFDPERNSMELNIRAYDGLTAALAKLEPVNETLDDETVHITSIMDGRRKENGVLTLGETMYAAGWKFLIDTSRDDEGVWLESESGEKILRARTIASTATTLDFAFDGETAPGEYRIAVYTRLGDPSRPAPAVTRRKVKLLTD